MSACDEVEYGTAAQHELAPYIWLLAKHFDFDTKQLARAIAATFEARKTPHESESAVLAHGIAERAEAQSRWAVEV